MASMSVPYNSDDSGGRLVRRRRTREEFGLNDVVIPGAMGSPKFVERVQVKTIETPPVRTLPEEELKKREEVMKAYRKGLEGGANSEDSAKVKAAAVTVNLVASTAAKQILGDEGSSEEDTSDEAYEMRHKQNEEEERERYNSAIASNGRKNMGDGRGRSMMAARPPGSDKRKRSGSSGKVTSDDTQKDATSNAKEPSVSNGKTPLSTMALGLQSDNKMAGRNGPFSSKTELVKPKARRGRPPGSKKTPKA